MAEKRDKTGDGRRTVVVNRKARHRFVVLDRVEAGLVLVGAEVKSIREGKISLDEAFGRIYDNEVFLVGAHIPQYSAAGAWQPDPTRRRKLLLRRMQIRRLKAKVTQKGLTLVPLEVYFNDRGLAKVTLALCRGKRTPDKRQDLKKKDARREMRQAR
ncbi:MAG: SsrA-binding protein SmpB [Planctomycetota bacterium]|jgi:SsrA-binding protein